MQPIKYFFVLAILFASCRGVRQNVALPTDVNHVPMAYAVSPSAAPSETVSNEPKTEEAVKTDMDETTQQEETSTKALPVLEKKSTKKVTSFAQWKEMAANGEIKMTKKEVKMLNKLDKKYNGNFEKFRSDTFEFTDKAKIIAGVGILGLLLAIFAGSWFGAFLFILAALGFILRFLGVIEF